MASIKYQQFTFSIMEWDDKNVMIRIESPTYDSTSMIIRLDKLKQFVNEYKPEAK
jgi:hypothetical protein